MLTKYCFGAHAETGAVTAAVKEGEALPYFSAVKEGKGTRFAALWGRTMWCSVSARRCAASTSGEDGMSPSTPITRTTRTICLRCMVRTTFHRGRRADVRRLLRYARAHHLRDRLRGQREDRCFSRAGRYRLSRRRRERERHRAAVPCRHRQELSAAFLGVRLRAEPLGLQDGEGRTQDRRPLQRAGMPLEYICLDIDYMDRYIDFTVNKQRFPDMKGLVKEMKARGVRLVPIVDAGIKIEPHNPVYEEGVKEGYFCKIWKGKTFKRRFGPDDALPRFLASEGARMVRAAVQVLYRPRLRGVLERHERARHLLQRIQYEPLRR